MSEVFDGTVEVQDSSGNGPLLLNGDLRQIVVFDAAGTGRIFLDGEANITTRDAALHPVIGLYSTGEVIVSRVLGADNITVLRFLAAQASLSIGDRSDARPRDEGRGPAARVRRGDRQGARAVVQRPRRDPDPGRAAIAVGRVAAWNDSRGALIIRARYADALHRESR